MPRVHLLRGLLILTCIPPAATARAQEQLPPGAVLRLGEPTQARHDKSGVRHVTFAPDGKRIAVGQATGEVVLYDATSGQMLRRLQSHQPGSSGLIWLKDGRLLAGNVSRLTGWEAATGKELFAFETRNQLHTLAFSPNGRYAAWGWVKWHGGIYDLENQRFLAEPFPAPGEGTTASAFAPESTLLALNGRNPDPDTIHLYDLRAPHKSQIHFRAGQSRVRVLTFAPQARYLLSAGEDGTVKCWLPLGGELHKEFRVAQRLVAALAFSPDGHTLAVASCNPERQGSSVLQLLAFPSGQEIKQWTGHAGQVTSLAFAPAGDRLVSGSTDGTALVWQLATGDSKPSLHQKLDAYIDGRFGAAQEKATATKELVEFIQSSGRTMAQVEELLRAGRHTYPEPPERGKLHQGLKLVCDHVDYETEYFLYVPKSYQPGQAMPLLLVGHGGNGAMSRSYASQATRAGIRDWLPVVEKEGIILAAPLSERGWGWVGDSILLSLLAKLQRDLHIDPDRIYVTGHSMGGHLSYRSGIFMPDRWGAVCPMSGGYDYVANGQALNLWNVPGYATYGTNEPYEINTFNNKIKAWMAERKYDWVLREKRGGHTIFVDEVPLAARFLLAHPRNLYRKLVFAQRDDKLRHDEAEKNPRWNREHHWTPGRIIDRSTVHWLKLFPLPADTPREKTQQMVRGEIVGPNRIALTCKNARQVRVYLHPRMVDFRQPVTITVNGQIAHEGKVQPRWETFLELVRDFDDRGRLFHAAIDLSITTDQEVPEPRG